MPVITLGCMRFQQEWGPRIQQLNQVGSDVQDNLVAILKRAIEYGMIHIETARGYGCSELQLGFALQQLFATGFVQREDLIIQTKVPPNADPEVFRAALELSFKNLKVDYIDLFAFHGLNYEEQVGWIFDNNGCLAVVREFVEKGRIKHVGFSTHGSTDLICRCIQKDVFEYVNLHYHYFGSYTASGKGNIDAVELLKQKQMGTFIISPFDKGGRLYAPSHKLCSLTLPEMEPIMFQSLWTWNHHRDGAPQLHTYTIGAGRPSDLDQPFVAAYLHSSKSATVIDNLQTVVGRLDKAKVEALGKEWVENWWKGLPKALGSNYLVEHNQMVWIYNNIKAYGMFGFGKARYASFEGNEAKWDESMSDEDNIDKKIGKNSWGFVPGRAWRPDADYSQDLKDVPSQQLQRVKDAEQFVYDYCRKAAKVENIPSEWETAYDMRPWPDYPDRPSRK